jgi:hypothetical protein
MQILDFVIWARYAKFSRSNKYRFFSLAVPVRQKAHTLLNKAVIFSVGRKNIEYCPDISSTTCGTGASSKALVESIGNNSINWNTSPL